MLERAGTLDTMRVVVERREAADPAAAIEAGRRVEHLVKSRIGVSVEVDVVDPGSVERSVGKMRRLVDRRPVR
ncbi:hypothetical protein GCM10009719_25550 [Nocardioides kribbensis]